MAAEAAKIIDLQERVTVTCTGKNQYHTEGEVMEVAPAVAEWGKKIGHYVDDSKKKG